MTPAAGGCGRLSGVASGPAQATGRRRRRLSEDERREQIIRGCVQVLAREGYRNASLARIAQAAGVSKGLVPHYFSDKDTLMEQTAIATVAYLRAEVGSAIDLTADVPDVLRSAVHYASSYAGPIPASCARSTRSPTTYATRRRPATGSRATRRPIGPKSDSFSAANRNVAAGLRHALMAVTYQGAVDTMIAYLDAHPETDAHAYADALVGHPAKRHPPLAHQACSTSRYRRPVDRTRRADGTTPSRTSRAGAPRPRPGHDHPAS